MSHRQHRRLVSATVRDIPCARTRCLPPTRGSIRRIAYKSRDVKDTTARVKAKDGDSLQREQFPEAWFAGAREIVHPVISGYLQGLLHYRRPARRTCGTASG